MSTVCPPALKAVAWFGTGVMTRGGRGGLRRALNPEPCVLRTTSPDTDLSGEAAVVTRPGSQGHSHWAVGAEGDRGPRGLGGARAPSLAEPPGGSHGATSVSGCRCPEQ